MRANSSRFIWPAPMPGGGAVLRVRQWRSILTCLAIVEANGRNRRASLAPLGARLGHDLEVVAADPAVVGLGQPAAGDRLDRHARPRRVRPVSSRRKFFLAANTTRASSSASARDDHLGEDPAHRLGGGAIERAVDGDDAAECRHAVAGESRLIGLGERPAQGDAAGLACLTMTMHAGPASRKLRDRLRAPHRRRYNCCSSRFALGLLGHGAGDAAMVAQPAG